MTYDEFLSKYRLARAEIEHAYLFLTPAQRRTPRGSDRTRRIRAAHVMVIGTGAVALERVGISIDEARDLARAGLANLYPDRFGRAEAIAPKAAAR